MFFLRSIIFRLPFGCHAPISPDKIYFYGDQYTRYKVILKSFREGVLGQDKPVWNQPSIKTSFVRSSRLKYPENKVSPLMHTSPRGLLERASYPISGTDSRQTSTLGTGGPTVPSMSCSPGTETNVPAQVSVKPTSKFTIESGTFSWAGEYAIITVNQCTSAKPVYYMCQFKNGLKKKSINLYLTKPATPHAPLYYIFYLLLNQNNERRSSSSCLNRNNHIYFSTPGWEKSQSIRRK